MEQNIKFDKEKVWKAIEKDQSKKRRKKFFFFYFLGFLFLGAGSLYLFIDSADNSIIENQEQIITQNVLQDPIQRENAELLTSNDKTVVVKTESDNISAELESKQTIISNQLSERVAQSEERTFVQAENNLVGEPRISELATTTTRTTATTTTTKDSNKSIDNNLVESNKVSDLGILLGIPWSPLIYERSDIGLNWDYLDVPEKEKPFSIAGKGIFVQSSLLFGETRISGEENLSEVWNTTQSLNFINSNSLGLELEFKNNLSFRSGLRLDIISTTYDLNQTDLQEGIVENDTVAIYANRILTGNRNYTTSVDRRIVNHNNIYRIGLPVAIGYKIKGKKLDVKFYGQSTISYFQSFSGIASTQDFKHEFDQQSVNDAYFNNKWSVRLSGMILLEKKLSKSLKMNAGIEMAFSERLLSEKGAFNLDYRGVGLSVGLSYGF